MLTKRRLKINFTDFWLDFRKDDNYFTHLLSKKYDVELCDDPEILFYSYFGLDHRNYKCLRVLFQGENIRPNFRECDFAFSFDYIPDNPRNYRLPLYIMYDDINRLTLPKNAEKIAAEKTKFCAFVASNRFSTKRIKFFQKLSEYKPVDSGGKILNNVGGPVKNKVEFLKDYKFNIAFENASYPGYTTEKVYEPMLVNTIPIYWGNPLVGRDFNTRSFINYHEYGTDDAIIRRIIEVDQNREEYIKMLNEPFLTNNELNEFVKEENIMLQIDLIVNSISTMQPVATMYKPTSKIYLRIKDREKYIGSLIHLLFTR